MFITVRRLLSGVWPVSRPTIQAQQLRFNNRLLQISLKCPVQSLKHVHISAKPRQKLEWVATTHTCLWQQPVWTFCDNNKDLPLDKWRFNK